MESVYEEKRNIPYNKQPTLAQSPNHYISALPCFAISGRSMTLRRSVPGKSPTQARRLLGHSPRRVAERGGKLNPEPYIALLDHL